MKKTIVFYIDEEQTPKYQVHAVSKKGGVIEVSAPSTKIALDILPDLEEELNKQVENFVPEDPEGVNETDTPKDFETGIADIEEKLLSYEEGKNGKRLLAKIEKADKFAKAKMPPCSRYLSLLDFWYIAYKYRVDVYEMMLKVFHLGFKYGYDKKKEHTK